MKERRERKGRKLLHKEGSRGEKCNCLGCSGSGREKSQQEQRAAGVADASGPAASMVVGGCSSCDCMSDSSIVARSLSLILRLCLLLADLQQLIVWSSERVALDGAFSARFCSPFFSHFSPARAYRPSISRQTHPRLSPMSHTGYGDKVRRKCRQQQPQPTTRSTRRGSRQTETGAAAAS